ncbi:MAG: hypothetical protein ACYDHG_12595, partial [Desulfomonilaceae bacterium]
MRNLSRCLVRFFVAGLLEMTLVSFQIRHALPSELTRIGALPFRLEPVYSDRTKGGIAIMLSCSFHRMRFPLLLGMVVMLGWLSNSHDVQAQSTGNKPSIQKKWTFKAPSNVWLGQPVPVGDSFFITSDDHLNAVDTQTGRMRWRFGPG